MKIAICVAVALCIASELALALNDGSDQFYSKMANQVTADAPGIRVLLTDAARRGAVCLDGTPGAYYYRAGSGDGASKFYIHHQGGGWCENDASCLERSKTDLGSSAKYPVTANLGGGYFSQDPSINPQMHNWNTIFIRYCDGASYSGNNETVTVVGGTKIFYRGFRVLEAIVDDVLAHRGLKHATDVVVSGCSAGGLATFLHVDYWASRLSTSTKVRGMPDSGFFLDYQGKPGYHAGMIWSFEHQNCTAGVNQECIRRNAGQTWKCMFAEHTSPHIKTPIFPLQSEYDSWQIGNDLGTSDPVEVNHYGANLTALVQHNLLSLPQHGIFLDSCEHHCGEWGNIRINGKLIAQAFQEWYEGSGAHAYLQAKPFPCKECCSPNS